MSTQEKLFKFEFTPNKAFAFCWCKKMKLFGRIGCSGDFMLHRKKGPAIIWIDGDPEHWINGKFIC